MKIARMKILLRSHLDGKWKKRNELFSPWKRLKDAFDADRWEWPTFLFGVTKLQGAASSCLPTEKEEAIFLPHFIQTIQGNAIAEDVFHARLHTALFLFLGTSRYN